VRLLSRGHVITKCASGSCSSSAARLCKRVPSHPKRRRRLAANCCSLALTPSQGSMSALWLFFANNAVERCSIAHSRSRVPYSALGWEMRMDVLRNKLCWFPLRITDFGSLVSSTWCFVGPSSAAQGLSTVHRFTSEPSRMSSSFNRFFTSLSTNITP